MSVRNVAAQRFYELLPFGRVQYALYYLSGAVLAVPLGAERANLGLMSLVAAGFPYGLRAVLREFKLDERARAHQEKLTALRDKAAAEGKTDLVAKIDARLARLQERHDRVVARLKEIHDKGQGRCSVGDPTVPAPAAS